MVSVGLRVQGQESNSVHPAHQLDPLVVLINLAEPGSLGSQSSWPVQGLTLLLLEPLLEPFNGEPPAPLPSSQVGTTLGETPGVERRRSVSQKVDAVGFSRLLLGFLCRSSVQDLYSAKIPIQVFGGSHLLSWVSEMLL